jgi:cytochrome c oxidase assembly factor CtaG
MDSSTDDEFDRKYDLLKHEIDRAEDLRKSFQGANSNSTNINVNMGGQAVWIACAACAVMLAINFMLMFQISDMKADARSEKEKQETINREFQYQFNAIYSRAPYLKENQNARHPDNP